MTAGQHLTFGPYDFEAKPSTGSPRPTSGTPQQVIDMEAAAIVVADSVMPYVKGNKVIFHVIKA